MYLASACPCCQSTNLQGSPALVAPFIREFALAGKAPEAQLIECQNCGFRFFDRRYEAEEMSALYSQYRSENYFQARNRHEFWYTRVINDQLGKDPKDIAARRAYVEKFLSEALGEQKFASILDYGGDAGQFIPDGIANRKFVHEVSDVAPVSGVAKLGSETELKQHAPYSLIMVCHVLEHLPDPAEILMRFPDLQASGEGWLLIEVPHERYNLRYQSTAWPPLRRLVERYRPLRLLNEIYTLYFRTRWNMIPPFGFPRLHEHINFYSVDSLGRLLKRCGFDVVRQQIIRTDTQLGRTESLLMLARRAGAAA